MKLEQMYRRSSSTTTVSRSTWIAGTVRRRVHHVNPTCGDELTLRLRLSGRQTIEDVSYDAGLSISQASTSMMADLIRAAGGRARGSTRRSTP